MSLKLTIKKIFIATILVFSSRAMGDVLMYNAAYTKTWEDSLTSKKGHKLVLERNYHSRSLHHGILGVGWCFEFEKSLKFMSPRKIELHDCFSRTKIVFSKVNKDTFTDLTGLLEITQKKNQFTLKKPKAQKEVYNSSGQLIEYKSQS